MSNEDTGSVDLMSTGDKPKTEIRIIIGSETNDYTMEEAKEIIAKNTQDDIHAFIQHKGVWTEIDIERPVKKKKKQGVIRRKMKKRL